MAMTVQLAQVQNNMLRDHEGMPWERIMEHQELANECIAPQQGLASLIGTGPSNYSLAEDNDGDEVCRNWDQELTKIVLAQVQAMGPLGDRAEMLKAEEAASRKHAEELKKMIEEQSAKVQGLVKQRDEVSRRKLPKTEEEAMKVIRNETQSQSTKDCLTCLGAA